MQGLTPLISVLKTTKFINSKTVENDNVLVYCLMAERSKIESSFFGESTRSKRTCTMMGTGLLSINRWKIALKMMTCY